MMTESKSMTSSELRERVVQIRYRCVGPASVMATELIADIDAAAPAMEDQGLRAASWDTIADFVATRSLNLLSEKLAWEEAAKG